MNQYQDFARFYDDTLSETSHRIAKEAQRLIATMKPNAKSVLEIGCGTRTVLQTLKEHYASGAAKTDDQCIVHI